jgi:hypothetical protein
MNKTALEVQPSARLPWLVVSAGERAGVRFLEFFASAIRNPHTRRAYARAASDFLAWCAGAGVTSITAVQPLHVASWIELQMQTLAVLTVKQRLAAIRHLFDWLVTGEISRVRPLATGRGSESRRKQKNLSTASIGSGTTLRAAMVELDAAEHRGGGWILGDSQYFRLCAALEILDAQLSVASLEEIAKAEARMVEGLIRAEQKQAIVEASM